MIDILNIEPTKVSRDLQGKFILIYSQPKVGKTSFAVQMPKNLLLAFEHGYNALGGIKAVDIDKWMTFKQVIRQLRQEEAKEMYKTITIDTAGIAYTLCEEYICNQQNVNKIGDIVMLLPKNSKWDSFMKAIDMFSQDFMENGRADDVVQKREEL